MHHVLFAADTDTWLETLRHLHVESVLLPVLVQLMVIILTARTFAVIFRLFGQPAVIGEVAAGIVLGPSVLGALFPELSAAIFHPTVEGIEPALFNVVLSWIMSTLSQLGLIFLLFLVGLEFDFSHLRTRSKSALAISVSGVVLPFALGVGLAILMHAHIEPHPTLPNQAVPALGFALFLGTALSITAIPVLGRIMLELGIQRTRLGAITISAAAVDDATGWILLATIAAIVRGQFDPWSVLKMIGETVVFALLMLVVLRPVVLRWAAAAARRAEQGGLGLGDLSILLAGILACAMVTNLIGIFAVFGAFLLGATLSSDHAFREAVGGRLRAFVTAFFLPIYFTYTGLRTQVDTLNSAWLWVICAAVLVAAIAGKLGGCGLAAWRTGFSRREAACIGAMMNTRGLMELVVINLGYDLHVIPKSVFCMLVLMALVTTVMTTPLLVALARGTELEEPIRESGFGGRRR